ncbi:MAG: DUF3793 family protein [Chloroflexaceae bacterium]|nr:DUF3793 family protein [Chloroflexaceae bacterium]
MEGDVSGLAAERCFLQGHHLPPSPGANPPERGSAGVLGGTLGYVCPITAHAFVFEVGQRWREGGNLPHEIGLALGYPVKDVLGYMGLLPLDFTGCCGWRVYGDPSPSFAMSRACQDAVRCALRLLHQPAHGCLPHDHDHTVAA